MIIMKAPDTCCSCSVGGKTLTPNKKGLVAVPEEHFDALYWMGFRVAAPEDSEDQDSLAAWFATQNRQDELDKGQAEKAALDQKEADAQAELRAAIDKAEKG